MFSLSGSMLVSFFSAKKGCGGVDKVQIFASVKSVSNM